MKVGACSGEGDVEEVGDEGLAVWQPTNIIKKMRTLPVVETFLAALLNAHCSLKLFWTDTKGRGGCPLPLSVAGSSHRGRHSAPSQEKLP